ncbi:hypothetical protein TPR58_20345 [Sphingomonas sp. HF-S3]|uniref:DUF4123 domain-containing protein n=1 Tax=Sphingomonas rustica TaxID=3103142 RepID=A0ABV0BFC0_9SPHN
MDMSRGTDRLDSANDPGIDSVETHAVEVGGDERRMHVRAYNYWVSLLNGRPQPSIQDLDPQAIAGFGPHSVLLDFSCGEDDPQIRFLGRALRDETGLDASITHVAQVPSRSLLSRLTDHYLQIIANRAPIGFEAEFVGLRGLNTLYRGILMPFSSTGDAIDFIYGVINWKEMVDSETQARLETEVAESCRAAPTPPPCAAAWADGPGADFAATTGAPDIDHADIDATDIGAEAATIPGAASTLVDRLTLARETAAAARASDTRSRSALHRALSRAYDFAVAAQEDEAGLARLLDQAGLAEQECAPMAPCVALVFGPGYDKDRIAEFAALLTRARRSAVPVGALETFLDGVDGGVGGGTRAGHAPRRADDTPVDLYARAAEMLRRRAPLAHVAIDDGEGEFTLLLARRGRAGLDIVASVDGDPALVERAVRKVAA